MRSYAKVIKSCSKCPNLYVRKMAAHALLPFIHLNDYPNEIKDTLTNTKLHTDGNNLIHGNLLWVQVLI